MDKTAFYLTNKIADWNVRLKNEKPSLQTAVHVFRTRIRTIIFNINHLSSLQLAFNR